MELQKLNIDKYINSYKELSKEKETSDRRKGMPVPIEVIKTWEKFKESIDVKDKIFPVPKTVKDITKPLEKAKTLNEVYYIPDMQEWGFFDDYRQQCTNTLIEHFQEQIKKSALPEIEYLKKELQRVNENGLQYSALYETGTPLLEKVLQGKYFYFELANDVSDIDYCKWLDDRIKEIDEQPENDAEHTQDQLPLLQWNAQITTFYTFFYDCFDKGLISWAGETHGLSEDKTKDKGKMQIARMLYSYFLNKDGNRLSMETTKQTLKPKTRKAKKRIDVSNIPLLRKKQIKKT